jgi:hypothetical protein
MLSIRDFLFGVLATVFLVLLWLRPELPQPQQTAYSDQCHGTFADYTPIHPEPMIAGNDGYYDTGSYPRPVQVESAVTVLRGR